MTDVPGHAVGQQHFLVGDAVQLGRALQGVYGAFPAFGARIHPADTISRLNGILSDSSTTSSSSLTSYECSTTTGRGYSNCSDERLESIKQAVPLITQEEDHSAVAWHCISILIHQAYESSAGKQKQCIWSSIRHVAGSARGTELLLASVCRSHAPHACALA